MKLVLSFLRGHTIYALILLLAIFVIGVEVVRPGTVNPLWASNTILFAAPLAIMAGGQTLVMLTGGIDLSVASVATGAAYLLATNASAGSAIAIGIALLLGLIVGIINGIGVALLRVQPLVMTLGTGLMTGGVLIVYSQHMMASQPHVPDIIQTLGAGRVFGLVPIDLFLWLIIAALILFGLQRTGFGRLLYAVGDNREACHLAGVRVWRVLFVNYVLCAILAAIAGLVVVGGTNAADLSLADSYLLPSVACVVIGGTSIFGGFGTIFGTVVGLFIPAVLQSGFVIIGVQPFWQGVAVGSVLIAAVYVDQTRRAAAMRSARSRGLFNRRRSKERKASEP
jgi:ribose transport system permease protein